MGSGQGIGAATRRARHGDRSGAVCPGASHGGRGKWWAKTGLFDGEVAMRAARLPRNMPSSPSHRVRADGAASGSLAVDKALQLLAHAGIAPPSVAPGTTEWLQGLIDALCELSSRDPLTGLVNRRSFELALARELDRVARSGESALVLMIDIDHFKLVNDHHGHASGDLVLQAVAKALAASVRPMDTVARFGGEEFAIILPNCSPAFGPTVAERVRRRVKATQVDIGHGEPLRVTVSIGGAFAPQWVRSSAALWIERADRQLYQAKSQGRNRVCIEPAAISPVSSEEKGMLFAALKHQDES
jgi:diguanylate cyclase (GGDEF)-like protein